MTTTVRDSPARLADHERRVAAFHTKHAHDDWSTALPPARKVAHPFSAEHNFPRVFQ